MPGRTDAAGVKGSALPSITSPLFLPSRALRLMSALTARLIVSARSRIVAMLALIAS